MKKYIWIFIAMILLSSCSSQTGDSSHNAPDKIEIDPSIDSTFIEPGTIIDFTVKEDGNEVDGDLSINVDQPDLVDIREDNSIKVLEDVSSGKDLEIQLEYADVIHNIEYIVRDSLKNTINEDGVITNPSDYDAVVNKQRYLPMDYIPEDLVYVAVPTVLPNPEIRQLRKTASDALTQLFDEAKSQGHILHARSGYRSYNTQKALYDANVANKGQDYADKYSAKPGTSEHQTGLVMDITSEAVNFELWESFGQTPEGIWVSENAHHFGFIIRYPEGKEEIVGYAYEPWHLRYLGVELATKVYESGLTLEEYFEQ